MPDEGHARPRSRPRSAQEPAVNAAQAEVPEEVYWRELHEVAVREGQKFALKLSRNATERVAISAGDEDVIRAVLRRFYDQPEGPDAILTRFGATRLSAVSTEAPPPLLIDRLDPSGHTILYGTGGVGKGVLSCDWLVSLAGNGHTVLIADYENHPGEWARRVYGLGGPELMEQIILVAPLTAAWKGKRGPLWEQAADMRELAQAVGATALYVDSIVPACAGMDPLKPEAVALYTGALEYIGLPALSLAHVPKDGDLRYPFGSVFWHNLARVTYSLEKAGSNTVIVQRKANNYERRPKQAIEMTWVDGRPESVWERAYSEVIGDRVRAALAGGPMTVPQLVEYLNDESLDEDTPAVKADTVRKALLRGSRVRPAIFAKLPGEKWGRT